MAVYTHVTPGEAQEFLNHYDIGDFQDLEAIAAGVSNTNYLLTTSQGRFILTLFEPHRVRAEDVPAFLQYSYILQKSGIPCPETMRRRDGSYHALFKRRPTAIFSFLKGAGAAPENANPARCAAAGILLARMHGAGAAITDSPDNSYSLPRWRQWVKDLSPRMNQIAPGLEALAEGECAYIDARWPDAMPRGAIHGDYFPDNVFFEGDAATGVIDFHFVCRDFFAYDLAIAINAWCFDEKNIFSQDRMDRFMGGYQSIRPLNEKEKAVFPLFLRAAALRFLLSRIEEKLSWKPGDCMTPHDPMVFEKRLKHFQRIRA